MSRDQLKNNLVFFGLVFLALIISYFPQLNGEFIGDDSGRIEDLINTRPLSFLYNTLGDRPLLILSIWFDRFVLGFDVLGMRIESLIIAAFVSVMMREFLNQLSEKFNQPINPYLRDGLIILFAIHPLNTQAVGHIVQRGILFSSLLGLFSTWLLLRCGGNPRSLSWKVALLSWCLALLAKPNIAFLPLWWGLMIYLMGNKRYLPYLSIFFLMLFIPVINYSWGGYNPQSTADALNHWDYFLTQGRALFHYLRLMLFPWPLYFIHDLPPTKGGDVWPGLFLWVVYLGSLILLWKKSSNKALKLLVTGGFLAFLPESSFFPIIHVFFEHRVYTPMIFFIGGVAFIPLKMRKEKIIAAFSGVAILFGIATFIRSQQVKTYAEWVLHEMRPSVCQIPYFTYYVLNRLINKGEVDLVMKSLEKADFCKENPSLISVLETEIKIAKSGKVRTEDLDKLKEFTHSDFYLPCPIRNLNNHFLIHSVLKSKEQDHCMLEEYFSHQLRYMFKSMRACLPSIQHYYSANSLCMIQLDKKGIKNNFQRLKMRTIRYTYFNKDDPNLGRDLEKAKETEDILYLKSMYKKIKAGKDILKSNLNLNSKGE